MTTKPTISEIIAAVSTVTRVSRREIRGRDIGHRVRHARRLVYFVANQCYGITAYRIAKDFQRNPRTAARVLEPLIAEARLDPKLIDQIEAIVDAAVARRFSAASHASMEITR